VFIVVVIVYFVIDSVRKLLDKPSYIVKSEHKELLGLQDSLSKIQMRIHS